MRDRSIRIIVKYHRHRRSVFRWYKNFRSGRKTYALDQVVTYRQYCFFHYETSTTSKYQSAWHIYILHSAIDLSFTRIFSY